MGDGILNVLLFFPLGGAIAWSGRPVVAAGLFGLLLASVIEIAQTILPGRDPALSDILLNAAGALAGAIVARRRRVFLAPDAKESAILTAVALLVAASTIIATAYLLSPLPGVPSHADRQLPGSAGEAPAHLRTLLLVEPSFAEEPVLIARSRNDLLLRYPSKGSAFGFDQPEYWGSGALSRRAGGEPTTVSVSRDRSRWDIRIGTDRATLGPTAGRGWAALAYPDEIGRNWGHIVSSVWLLALFLPIGFWARGRARFAATVMVVVLLAAVPEITGLVPTGLLEWAGALTGVLAGSLFAFSRRPRRSGPAPSRID